MEKWRLLKLGTLEVYTASALWDMLLLTRSRNLIPNTLVLHQVQSAVFLGRMTSISVVDTVYCEQNNIPIGRVLWEGSAGVMKGSLSCDLVFAKDSIFFTDREIGRKSLLRGVIKGLNIVGIKAVHIPRSNDLLVDGKKICGAALIDRDNSYLFYASVLLDFDYDMQDKALIVPKGKGKVRDRVTTVQEILGKQISFEEASNMMKRGFEEELNILLDVATELTDVEKEVIENLREKHESESWIKYGKWSPVKEY